MEIGLGILALTPACFWSLTVPEFNAKFRGFREFNCSTTGPSDREADAIRGDMVEMLEEFPDGELRDDVRRRHKRNKAEAERLWLTTR